MRDPNRIDQIIEVLRAAWHRHPDMRLGQLLLNAQRWMDHVDSNRVCWVTEDNVTQNGLESMARGEAPGDEDPVAALIAARIENEQLRADLRLLESAARNYNEVLPCDD